MGKATVKQLAELHGEITETIKRRIKAPLLNKDGEPVEGSEGLGVSSSDIANAIGWMKHNSITADPETNQGLNDLREQLLARQRKGGTAIDAEAVKQAAAELEQFQGLGGMKQ